MGDTNLDESQTLDSNTHKEQQTLIHAPSVQQQQLSVPSPCLMRLPTELKLVILELLPAVDVAKVSCVCLELRGLSSNNDLWKQRFLEEFGTASVNYYVWTEKFVEELGTKSFSSYVWERKFVEDFGTESRNYYLWKEKFIEEIRTAVKGTRFVDHWRERFAGGRWRERFASSWESREKRKRAGFRCGGAYPRFRLINHIEPPLIIPR